MAMCPGGLFRLEPLSGARGWVIRTLPGLRGGIFLPIINPLEEAPCTPLCDGSDARPEKAAEVADLIETEYVPQLKDVDGVVSYTLVDVGEDEISSLGIFESEPAAATANDMALAWAKDRLPSLGTAPRRTRSAARDGGRSFRRVCGGGGVRSRGRVT
jgi:hypothetical protein